MSGGGRERVGGGEQRAFARLDEYVLGRSPFNPVVGLARTILAMSTALTLMATPVDQAFFRSVSYPEGVVCGSRLAERSLFCLASDAGQVDLAKWIALGTLLAVGTGFAPRWTALPHWYVAWSFSVGSPIPDGGDHITSILTLLLVPLSLLDCRRWHWQPDTTYQDRAVWVRFAAYGVLALWTVQICILYFQAAVAKFGVTEWADGSALWYWMQNPTFGPPDPLQDLVLGVLQYVPLVVIITYGTLLFQVTLAFAFLLPWRVRRFYLVAAVIFHFGIAATMGLWSFSAAMIAADLIFLIRPGEPLRYPWLRATIEVAQSRLRLARLKG